MKVNLKINGHFIPVRDQLMGYALQTPYGIVCYLPGGAILIFDGLMIYPVSNKLIRLTAMNSDWFNITTPTLGFINPCCGELNCALAKIGSELDLHDLCMLQAYVEYTDKQIQCESPILNVNDNLEVFRDSAGQLYIKSNEGVQKVNTVELLAAVSGKQLFNEKLS